MPTLPTLPDEILILICRELTLSALLNFRLVHRHFASLVLRNSISIAPSVARISFPEAELLLRASLDERQDFEWLKYLVLRYIAAVLVDRFRLVSERAFPDLPSRGIPAESEIGNGLRLRVERGLRIWKDLSAISKKSYKPLGAKSGVRASRPRLQRAAFWRKRNEGNKSTSSIKHAESAILEDRLDYLRALSLEQLEDYQLMTEFLYASFITKHDPPPVRSYSYQRFEYDGPDNFDWNLKKGIVLEKGTSWVNWAILHLGPHIFFQQWSLWENMEASTYPVKDCLIEMWKERSPDEIEIQRRSIASTYKAIPSRNSGRPFLYSPPVENEFERYRAWEHGLQRFHSGESLPHDWMSEIAFFINFAVGDGK